MVKSITPSQRIRITIALCVQKHKPPEQSYASYLLDLRAKFPTKNASSSEESRWRERVLLLERNLTDLQKKYDVDLSELVSLRTSDIADSSLPPSSLPISSPASKKKKKTQRGPSNFAADLASLRRDYEKLKDRPVSTNLPCTTSVFATHLALQKLMSPEEGLSSIVRITATARQAFEVLAACFKTMLPPERFLPSSPELFKIVSILLSHLLSSVVPQIITLEGKHKSKIPTEIKGGSINEMMKLLTTTILDPLIRSLQPLSHAYILETFNVSGKKAKKDKQAQIQEVIDLRLDVLGLVNNVLSILDKLSNQFRTAKTYSHVIGCFGSVREYVTLLAIRELDKVFTQLLQCPSRTYENEKEGSDISKSGSSSWPTRTGRSQDCRFATLSTKDSIWYLCSVLDLTARSCLPSTRGDGLLREGILGALANLLGHIHKSAEKHTNPMEENAVSSKTCHGTSQRCCSGGRRSVIDDVCGQMVLAVSERVWLRETQDS